MSMNNSLAAALSKINNAEKTAKKEVSLAVVSKTLRAVLDILKDNLYLGGYSEQPESYGVSLKLNLIGSINKCGVISPRSSYKLEDSDKLEKQYLPAKGFGLVIVSTSQGIMTLSEAKDKKIGGKLIAYCY